MSTAALHTPLSDSPVMRARVYRDGQTYRETTSIDEIIADIQVDNTVAWLDLLAPQPADMHEMADRLGLHPLAVEDALAEPQRPKLDRYAQHLFIAVYLGGYEPASCKLNLAELSVFVTDRVLVTARQNQHALDPSEIDRRLRENADLGGYGVGFLLHGLLDYVIDEQNAMTRQIEDAVEDLEDSLFDDPSGREADVQRRGFELRKTLTRARRIAQPTTDLLRDLDRPGVGVIHDALEPYFADVRDHAVRSAERLDSLREMVGAVLDTQLALRGDQLNEIMKKLTSWAAIIAVPTAVTGFYGQNVPYPGFQEWSGFVASITLTGLIAVLLYAVLKRRGWL
jgi:magnesium transporter